MGGEKTTSIFDALNLDDLSLSEKFIYIEEFKNADGSFFISSLLKDLVQKNQKVILVLCHNSIGHFYSISQKLGFNLSNLKDSEKVFIIDVMDKVVNNNFIFDEESIKNLYKEIKNQLNVWSDVPVSVVIENVGNLAFIERNDMLKFLHYLRVQIFNRTNSTLFCSLHNFSECLDFNNISKVLRHSADIVVSLEDLRTGRANDVTGHLKVIRKEQFVKYVSEHHYLLEDKCFRVFAPGTKEFSFVK